MKTIAAVDEKWGIGRDGRLLIRIPADQKNFREETMGGTVILGRKTLQTFPKGMPLPGRTNIILTRNPDFTVPAENAVIVHSEEELLEAVGPLDPDNVWVIGGESVYRALLPQCSEAVITRIDRTYEADAFFPDLERDPDWEKTEESEEQVYFDTTYRFERWMRKSSIRN
ncbi:MAG: dihydrofolate reductase [Lachnospiraceae bacterium]|nr:dihydrofolate reductase [Lachnospiraceae bacterium]